MFVESKRIVRWRWLVHVRRGKYAYSSGGSTSCVWLADSVTCTARDPTTCLRRLRRWMVSVGWRAVLLDGPLDWNGSFSHRHPLPQLDCSNGTGRIAQYGRSHHTR